MSSGTAEFEDGKADESGLFGQFLGGVGGPFVEIYGEISAIMRLSWRSVVTMFTQPIRWKEVVRQCHEMGNKSLFFICTVMGFLGLILVYQTGYQTKEMIGDLQLIGAMFLQLAFRELGPTITGTMLATRVGTGIAAEIGSMVVTEQVDALRMNNAEPVQYLIVPRIIACILMTLVLSCIGLIVAYLMGMLGAYVIFEVNPHTYYNTQLLAWGDLIIFLMKTLTFGAVIPVIGSHAGLTTFGGSEGVGLATTKAVVNSTLAIVTLDFVLTAFGYVAFFS